MRIRITVERIDDDTTAVERESVTEGQLGDAKSNDAGPDDPLAIMLSKGLFVVLLLAFAAVAFVVVVLIVDSVSAP